MGFSLKISPVKFTIDQAGRETLRTLDAVFRDLTLLGRTRASTRGGTAVAVGAGVAGASLSADDLLGITKLEHAVAAGIGVAAALGFEALVATRLGPVGATLASIIAWGEIEPAVEQAVSIAFIGE